MVVVLNLNIGNLGSIPNMLSRLSCEATVSADPAIIEKANVLILPGVGAFDHALSRIRESGLLPLIHHKVLEEKVPILGVCLGMQIMTESSEEGQESGLGWMAAKVKRFSPKPGLTVPHMGWNTVERNPNIPLLNGFSDDPRFYFVHSYHIDPLSVAPGIETANTTYDAPFPSVIKRDNIMGVQFHPEKSHRFGLQVFQNFLQFAQHWQQERAAYV